MLNSVLSALAVPFLFGVARVALPRAAVPVAAVAALGPSLISLSSVDLLKDPSVLCGMVALVWSVLRLTSERRLWPMVAFGTVGLVAGLYLRTARFYSFAYLEFAFVGALVFAVTVGRVHVFRRWAALAITCFVFVAGELLPIPAQWPPSALMVSASITTPSEPRSFGITPPDSSAE